MFFFFFIQWLITLAEFPHLIEEIWAHIAYINKLKKYLYLYFIFKHLMFNRLNSINQNIISFCSRTGCYYCVIHTIIFGFEIQAHQAAMAAPLQGTGVIGSDQTRQTIPKLTPKDVESFSFIMDHVIGNRRERRAQVIPLGGIPQFPKTREEMLVTGFFESCVCKSALSCVAGNTAKNVVSLLFFSKVFNCI